MCPHWWLNTVTRRKILKIKVMRTETVRTAGPYKISPIRAQGRRSSLLSGGNIASRVASTSLRHVALVAPGSGRNSDSFRPLAVKRARPEARQSLKEMYWPQAVLARSLSGYCLSNGEIQRIRWPVVPSHLIRLVSGRMMSLQCLPLTFRCSM